MQCIVCGTVCDDSWHSSMCALCAHAASHPAFHGNCIVCDELFTGGVFIGTDSTNMCSPCVDAISFLIQPPPAPDGHYPPLVPGGEPGSPSTAADPTTVTHPSLWYMCPGCFGLNPRDDTWPPMPWSALHVHPSPVIGYMHDGQVVPLVDPWHAGLQLMQHVLVASWCPHCYTRF